MADIYQPLDPDGPVDAALDTGVDPADPLPTLLKVHRDLTEDLRRKVLRAAPRDRAFPPSTGEQVISNFGPGHGWIKAGAGGTMTDDTSTYARGEQSLRLTTPNSTTSATFVDLAGSWDLTGQDLRLWIKTADYTQLSQVALYVGTTDLAAYDRLLVPDLRALRTDEWTVLTFSYGQSDVTGTPDRSAVGKIRVRLMDKATGSTTVWLGGLSATDQPRYGAVSFTYDDSHLSDYTRARPVLDRHGFAATTYTILDRVGTADRLSLAQLQTLQDLHGWDVSCHGSPDLTTLDEAGLEAEFAAIKGYLLDHGLVKGADHYAYPMGRYDPLVLDVARRYFTTARSIDESPETAPPPVPHRLRIKNVVNTTTAADVAAAVADARDHRQWLILLYHQIVDTGADVDTKVLASEFEQHVTDVAASGIPVLPVSEAYARLASESSRAAVFPSRWTGSEWEHSTLADAASGGLGPRDVVWFVGNPGGTLPGWQRSGDVWSQGG